MFTDIQNTPFMYIVVCESLPNISNATKVYKVRGMMDQTGLTW